LEFGLELLSWYVLFYNKN
jgi:hypothetical protein